MRLYKKSEALAETQDSGNLRNLADSLCQNLGDLEWAKKIYQKAEDKAKAFYEFRWLAERLCENMGDLDWAKSGYRKAENKANDSSDFCRLKNSMYENLGSDSEF